MATSASEISRKVFIHPVEIMLMYMAQKINQMGAPPSTPPPVKNTRGRSTKMSVTEIRLDPLRMLPLLVDTAVTIRKNRKPPARIS